MSVPVPVLAAASAAAVVGISFTALGVLRRLRVRRHLQRLRGLPVERE